ncbi:acetate/propionate family kinase [Hydrogenophaga sp.]|uniref:acetate/propionate family kinase n=1 Tax=Hydrogenophaga sp. TaxID=1904254 RepID=UPI00351E890F
MPMPSLLLTLNAGSSSLKFAVYETHDQLALIATGQIESLGPRATFFVKSTAQTTCSTRFTPELGEGGHAAAVDAILRWLEHAHPGTCVAAVSHRVVHGGVEHLVPARINDALLADLERLVPLAPLHQPHNLAGIRAARAAFPDVPQVACFDTSFHRTHPFVADTFALPRSFYEEGIRRYGFHGLSYEFIARHLRSHDPVLAQGRVVVAHLGNGASMCAMHDGRSVASTMGFTALDGLPMGTRCGQLDPGVVLYLMAEKGMDAMSISHLLYQQAGLKGISGLSHDVRELQESDSPAARDALVYFADRGRREIGGLAACLGGLDALVLTGGIGENAPQVRAMMLSGMEWMGIHIDLEANLRNAAVISHPSSRVRVLVFKTDEEHMLATHAAELLAL